MHSLIWLLPFAAAADLPIKPYEPEIAAIVGGMLQEAHYQERAIDDQVSGVWFDAWLETLDYQRMYFLQADVDAFRARRLTLDDGMRQRAPDLTLAAEMFDLLRVRTAERSKEAVALVDRVDITNDESWTPDRHEAGTAFAATDAELDEVWRQRVEHDLIGQLLVECGAEKPECFETNREVVITRLKKRYDLAAKNLADMDSTDMLEWYLGALASTYDPHTVWFAPARNDNFDIEITNSVEGIGAQLRVRDGFTTVDNVIRGGPADRDGQLKSGDKIIAVAQGDAEPVDVVDWRIDKVVKLIRGPKGSEVRLIVQPADKDPSMVAEIRLIRDRVNLEESAAKLTMREVDGKQLAVIDVPSFYLAADGGGKGVTAEVAALIAQAQAQNADGVLLDLSTNGGGSLREAVDMAGLFITAGPVVQIRDRDGHVQPLFDPDPRQVWTGPVVVLTSQASASASEIVAGALQDYGRALIVGGKQTHGKGTVQQVADVTRLMRNARQYQDAVGGALKVTIQKFYRVSGASTQLKGVVPDVVLPSPWDGLEVLESDLDHALAWDEIPPVPHPTAGGFADVLPALRSASAARVTANADFQELQADLAEREARRADKTMTLNLEARRQELLAANAKSEEEKEEEAEEAGSRTPPYLLDEGLHVLADLVDAR